MIEGIEANPQIWEVLFSDKEDRDLAKEFVGKISRSTSVLDVLAAPGRDSTGMEVTGLFVLMEDQYIPKGNDPVAKVYKEDFGNDLDRARFLQRVTTLQFSTFSLARARNPIFGRLGFVALYGRPNKTGSILDTRSYNYPLN